MINKCVCIEMLMIFFFNKMHKYLYLFFKVMLWSQIKLKSYDFTDLHITGEFDNRPGTRRFFKNFLMRGHISYGRRPASYMITLADARRGTVRRCKRSAGHRTVPGRFYANFQVQWWIHLYQNLSLFLQRNRLLKQEGPEGPGSLTWGKGQMSQWIQ